MSGRLLAIGDALLDRDVEGRVERLCPDAPVPVLDETAARARPGGAALAAALLAARGARVTLVSALGEDDAGGELRGLVLAAGVDLLDLGLTGRTPEKVRFLTGGGSLLRLDRGGGDGRPRADGHGPALRAALAEADAVLVSDYGRGVASHPEVAAALAARDPATPLVWDPHPRGPRPLAGATLATPNLAEAAAAAGVEPPRDAAALAGLGRELLSAWKAEAICVTCGARGATLLAPGAEPFSYAAPAAAGDPCGAGDMFAATATAALAAGCEREEAVRAAVGAATGFVAAGGARSLRVGALDRVERVRRRRGTVVATGGCFDLLHLGHARTLAAARALGDCLVVLLNSDRSVRRLKGADRPLVGEAERAAMLRALACVDEVVVFDEPTPAAALRALRPDVWAKGGDYELSELPESELVSSWGGRTAILPYLEGRSTTRLIEEVGERVTG